MSLSQVSQVFFTNIISPLTYLASIRSRAFKISSAVRRRPDSSRMSGARNALAVSNGLTLTFRPSDDQPWSRKRVKNGPSNAINDAAARYVRDDDNWRFEAEWALT